MTPEPKTADEDTVTSSPTERVSSRLAYLASALKTPTIGKVWEDLARRAREESWAHKEYLAAVLERQVADRESAGTIMRIRTAHFPQVKTLEDFNLDHLPSLRRDVLAHLATSTSVAKRENVILLGHPGSGRPTSRSVSASKPPTPITVSCSTPRTTGLPVSQPLITTASSRLS